MCFLCRLGFHRVKWGLNRLVGVVAQVPYFSNLFAHIQGSAVDAVPFLYI